MIFFTTSTLAIPNYSLFLVRRLVSCVNYVFLTLKWGKAYFNQSTTECVEVGMLLKHGTNVRFKYNSPARLFQSFDICVSIVALLCSMYLLHRCVGIPTFVVWHILRFWMWFVGFGWVCCSCLMLFNNSLDYFISSLSFFDVIVHNIIRSVFTLILCKAKVEWSGMNFILWIVEINKFDHRSFDIIHICLNLQNVGCVKCDLNILSSIFYSYSRFNLISPPKASHQCSSSGHRHNSTSSKQSIWVKSAE